MIVDCTAVILVGGQSRRMGSDKATLPLGTRTLLQEVVDAVAPLFPGLIVSVAAPRADLPWPQVCDERPGLGPLAGLCAALARAPTPWIFAVATDMPFVRPALVTALAAYRDDGGNASDAVVARVAGEPQPLAAFYSTRCLAPFSALLDAATPRARSLRAALACVATRYVETGELVAADPGLASFVDLDTPHDVELARRQLR